MALVTLLVKEIEDPATKENFRSLSQYLEGEQLLSCRFQHLDKTFTAAETLTLTHTLGAVPQDVIQTFKTGAGTITYNYGDFTTTTISVTIAGASTSAPLRVRMLIGRFS